MNGSDPSNFKISKISKQLGWKEKLDSLREYIKNCAGTFILKMRFRMYFQVELRKAKLVIRI
jgi:hypothetical protein